MKANILKTVIAIGIGLVLFSYIYTSKGYEIFTTTFFLFVFGSLILSMMIYPVCYWLFIALSKTYTIRKGMNYSGFRFKPFYNLKPFEAEIILHDSCKVETEGIQKIFGYGDFNHHINSERIGFRYNKENDEFLLYDYYYIEGYPETTPPFAIIKANQKIRVPFSGHKGFGKFLFPYFEEDGGKNGKGKGAPHDMKMTITIIR